jgi:type IX secretion system PorP/SprF family membrane protein
MRNITLILSLICGFQVFAQNRLAINQYMLNPGVYNPASIDVTTKFGANILGRKQWMRQDNTPETYIVNGHYNFSRNHGVGLMASNDRIDLFNQLEVSANYAYRVWIQDKVAIGFGVKAGFYQKSLVSDRYTYFSPNEPTLQASGLSQAGFNFGAGISVTTHNFDLSLSMPYMVANTLPGSQPYFLDNRSNHLYASAGYKIRFSDEFILYPTALVKAVEGSPTQGSFDINMLVNQFVWAGIGAKTDNTIVGSFGLFFYNGLRMVYTFDSSVFTRHSNLGVSHELSVGYAMTLEQNPFNVRKHRTKKGAWMKHRRN